MAGCTHTTYYKTLKRALGIYAVQWTTFQSTIKCSQLYKMADRMCEEAKIEMKTKSEDELGSWSRAVISDDGAWMTRGHHSKNFTFSIHNYYTGKDPCSVRFDHKSIRHHLTKCLEDCQFIRFPVLGERSSSGMKRIQKT